MATRLCKSFSALLVLLLVLTLLPATPAVAQTAPAAAASTANAGKSLPVGPRIAPEAAKVLPAGPVKLAPPPSPPATNAPMMQGGTWYTQTVDSAGDVGSFSSMALDADGYPHIAYYDATNQAIKYAQFDGLSWHIETVDATGAMSPSLALGASGNAHVSYYDAVTADLRYAYYNGAAWERSTVDSVGDVGSYSSLAVDSAGNPRIVYYDATNQVLKYAHRSGAWQIETVAAAGMGNASLALDSAGNPHVSYSYYDGVNTSLMYAHRSGATWVTEIVASGALGAYSSLALDAAANPHISYAGAGGMTWIQYAYFDGAAWQITWVADYASSYTSLALDSFGRPHISYLYNYPGTDVSLRFAFLEDDGWNTERVETADTYVAGTYISSLALDANGRPHISYYDGISGDLGYAYGSGLGWWSIKVVDSGFDVGQFSSLALDATGYPHIAYNDGVNEAIRYAYWDGSSWQMRMVDTTGLLTTPSVSLDLDTTGNPHIAYYDSINADLKYAYLSGTTWLAETVDSPGDVGSYASLDLDTDGNPHIAYYDATNQAVKYAHFDGNWQIEAVGDAGGGTSLALDPADRPRISYYDNTNSTLMYASFDGFSWQIETVHSAVSGGNTSLVVDSTGLPHIAFQYCSGGMCDLYYAFFDGASWLIPSVSWGSVYSALALDTAGNAHISYIDGGSNLRLAISRSNIYSWQIEEADYFGGGSPSIALDADGRTHITYRDAVHGEFRYAVKLLPEATDDLYSTPQDTPLVLPTWQSWGVLDNDSPENGLLRAALETPPAQGELTLFPDGSFVYTPTAGLNGLVTFAYAAQLLPDQDIATAYILVGDVDSPVAVLLDNDTVLENQAVGTAVGALSTLPTGHTYSYQLVKGTGSEDNAAFAIAGNQLQTAKALDYEQKNQLRLRVRTTDERGLFFDQVLSVRVGNVEPEPPGLPPFCTTHEIGLVDGEEAHVWISDITTATWAMGCSVAGTLTVELPNNRVAIPFSGHVDWWNHLSHAPLAPLDLVIAGVNVHVGRPQLSTYAGQFRLDLRESTLCAPAAWDGACKEGDQDGLLIDSGGFRATSGNLPLPEFGIPNAVPLGALQSAGIQQQVGSGLEKLNLKYVFATVTLVRDEQGQITGYEIRGEAKLGLPGFGANTDKCGLKVVVVLFQSFMGQVMLRIEQPPEPATPGMVEFREGKLTLVCQKGIPIGPTGLQLSGISGIITLKPDAQSVRLEVEITNVENFGLPVPLLKITSGITLLWKPEWGVDISGKVVILQFFEAANGEIEMRKDRVSLALHLRNLFMEGNITANAWWPDGNFHFAGSGGVDVGFRKGSIWSHCFWFVCIRIPPFNLTVGAGADFGEFTNGQWGAKAYVKVLGKQYGVYVDGDDFYIGGVGSYTLAEPPEFLAAYQRWLADRQAAALRGVQLDPMTWDDTFAFPRNDLTLVKTNIMPTDIFTNVLIITPTDVSFLVTTQQPVVVTLVTPDGITITPDNYFQPPVSPTHNVSYTYTTYITDATSFGYAALVTCTQYWYTVKPAMLGEWKIGIEGSITESSPMVAVLGFANIPQVTDVAVLDGGNPSQVQLGWNVTSDAVATMTVYATTGPITSTAVVTDGEGIPQTQVIYNYNGTPVGQFLLGSLKDVRGPGTGVVDLAALESGNYALWVGLDDDVHPGVYAYALTPATDDVAWVTVNNGATWPGTWTPTITPTIDSSAGELVLTWDALDHPDVDDYTVYIGYAPNTPDQVIMGLNEFYNRDEDGNPVGQPFVQYIIDGVAPGTTYYLCFEAHDVESGRTVRTAEISVAVPRGDYRLVVPKTYYWFPEGTGGSFTFPLSLQIDSPLFYPSVYLEIDESRSARGIVAQFVGDAVGDTALSAVSTTVEVQVWLDQYLPKDNYILTFIGRNGEMERRTAVTIHVGDVAIYLPLVDKNYGGPPRLVR